MFPPIPAAGGHRRGCAQPFGLILVCFSLLLVLAPGASAATITVNTTSDGGPSPNTGNCMLREAIVAANTDTASGGVAGECATGSGIDTINFAASFNGQLADTITLIGDGQEITQPVTVDGGDCDATAAASPCVGINAGGNIGFAVLADNVTIQGVAVTNAKDGINSAAIGGGAGGDGLVVRNSWFGLNVDGTPGTINTATGVLSAHNGGTIGGTTPADRNVFAKNTTGVRLVSGDNNAVKGNYFGTEPDGDANAALGNSIANVSVTSVPGFGTALNNTIGGPDAGTPSTCDGACNLLAPTSGPVSITVNGDSLPSGQTTVAGNFIGVTLAGGQLGTAASEVQVGGADDATIGGVGVASRNYIGLGSITIGAGATNVAVQGNFLGLNTAGTARIDTGGSIRLTTASGVLMADNRIAQDKNGTSAISLLNSPSNTMRGNVIGVGTGNQNVGGGTVAIDVSGDGSDNNLVGGTGPGDGNVVGLATGAAVSIFDADSNTVQGNRIGTDAAEAANLGYTGTGIDVGGTAATGNVIGGTTAASENVISNLVLAGIQGDAIRVQTNGNDGNQILRNRGTGNGGLFVELGTNGFGTGPNDANDDILAPTITAGATSALVSGTGARAGATVRVYRTGTAAAGDPNGLIAFAGQAVADGSGNWSLACPSAGCTVGLPGAGRVTANQTDTSGNSSEFSKAVAFADLPPDTTIDSGPGQGTAVSDATPTFGFSSTEPGSTFQCRIDGGSFAVCTSPATLGALGDGQHMFEVRAIDSALQVDASPASRTFTVDTTPPDTSIDSGPDAGSTTTDPTPSFGFSATEAGSAFECRIDAEAFAACTSEHTAAALANGQHTFEVRATDVAGNADQTPASRGFTVDAVSDPPPPGDGADTDPPETKIDAAPKDKLKVKKTAKATYAFSSDEPGSTFLCTLDGKPQAPCSSPLTLTKLKKGKHTFEVVARDAAGNVDQTPATDTFKVKKKQRKRRHR